MSAVSITLVKDEEQIIESFVRYNSFFVDRMIIIDNGCKDDTIKILKQLKKDGFNIEVYSEVSVGYMQAYLENKYMHIALDTGNEDWIVPLDSDEFLDMDKNRFDSMDKTKGYYVYWENYVVDENTQYNEVCVPRRLISKLVPTESEDPDLKITKVILSRRYIVDNCVYLSAGHHGIIDGGIDKLDYLEDVRIAHFPIVDEDQVVAKIYGKYIGYIGNELRGRNGVHVNRYVSEYEAEDLDINLLAAGEYTVREGNLKKYKSIVSQLRPDISDRIDMQYTKNNKLDLVTFFRKLAEEYALKLAIEKRHGISSTKKRILVFGTGATATYLFEQVHSEDLEVLAYIDTDPKNKYLRFNKELIISPDEIKFFDYEYIVLATVNRFDEMREILIEAGIATDRIVGREYLYNRMICGD